MAYIKRFFAVLCMFSFFACSAHAFPPSIARYTVIGANKEGDIAAFMLTHFGLSAHAPFAMLIIKKAGEGEPLFEDGAYKMEGNEKDLAELTTHLLEKDAAILKNYELDPVHISEANMVISANSLPEITSGWIDIIKRGTKEFTVKSIPSEYCANHSDAIDLEFWFNGVNKLTAKQKPDACWDNGFAIRNVYQTQKALWFVVNKHASGVNNQDVYFINIEGIAFR